MVTLKAIPEETKPPFDLRLTDNGTEFQRCKDNKQDRNERHCVTYPFCMTAFEKQVADLAKVNRSRANAEVELKLAIEPGDLPRLARDPAIRAKRRGRARPSSFFSVYYDTPKASSRIMVLVEVAAQGARWVQTLKADGRVRGGPCTSVRVRCPARARSLTSRLSPKPTR